MTLLPGQGLGSSPSRLLAWGLGAGESASVVITITDAGTFADAFDVAAALSLSDTVAAEDSISGAFAALAVTDEGAGAESAAVAALVSLADLGTGIDTPVIRVSVILEDSGAATEDQLTGYLIAVTEAATASEAVSLVASVAVVDQGQGADVITIRVDLALADSGAALDQLVARVQLAVSDAASGLDSVGPVNVLATVTDLGTLEDALADLTASLWLEEVGQGLDYFYRHQGPPPVKIILGATARAAGIKAEGHPSTACINGAYPVLTIRKKHD